MKNSVSPTHSYKWIHRKSIQTNDWYETSLTYMTVIQMSLYETRHDWFETRHDWTMVFFNASMEIFVVSLTIIISFNNKNKCKSLVDQLTTHIKWHNYNGIIRKKIVWSIPNIQTNWCWIICVCSLSQSFGNSYTPECWVHEIWNTRVNGSIMFSIINLSNEKCCAKCVNIFVSLFFTLS